MNKYQDDVQKFHIACDIPVGDYRNPKISRPELRIDLVREEGGELLAGLEARDLVATIDGAIDLAYVTYGAAVEFGVDLGDDCRCEVFPETSPPKFLCRSAMPCWLQESIDWLCVEIVGQVLRADFIIEANALIDFCHRIVSDCGVYWRQMWDEVHASNIKKAGGGKRADGKALKPHGWTPPDIKGILVGLGAATL